MGETEVDVSQWLDPKAVAPLYDRTTRTIYRWIKRGRFGKPVPAGGGKIRPRVVVSPRLVTNQSENQMSEVAKHPDIFTAEEAITYLHLDPDKGKRTLQTLRENGDLVGFKVGKALKYHRKSLDACIDRLSGVPTGKKGR